MTINVVGIVHDVELVLHGEIVGDHGFDGILRGSIGFRPLRADKARPEPASGCVRGSLRGVEHGLKPVISTP